jgi:hypothetical protein
MHDDSSSFLTESPWPRPLALEEASMRLAAEPSSNVTIDLRARQEGKRTSRTLYALPLAAIPGLDGQHARDEW